MTARRSTAARRLRRAYQRQRARVGGRWSAHVALLDPAGAVAEVLLDDDADRVLPGYSVQKLAVAAAVLSTVDDGALDLADLVEVTADDILPGSGSLHLHGVWGDRITVAHVLTALLLVSDNTAVRLCGRLVPGRRVNEILAANGFRHTRVEPVADSHRFYLGVTTARETADLLRRLATGSLLSPDSNAFVLRVMRGLSGYHDGIRRDMSSAERARVATRHGADFDERGAARHEVGIMYAADGTPALTYAFFADELSDRPNYGGTHPAVRAHATLGRALLELGVRRPVPPDPPGPR